jgi:hypothetical protein
MQAEKVTHVRLYCICGQKMKVSDDMYGRPGKCVACRQKIRIPRRDEVPPGVTDVYLKEHPEFLRKSARKAVKLPEVEVEVDVGATPVPEKDTDDAPVHPLDTLDALRVLCSLAHKVDGRLKIISESKDDLSTDRAEWHGYKAKVERARDELDEQLRQRLMETAIELTNTQEKIAEAGLAVRVGETEYEPFRETMSKLRARRDRLERRQANLRGWLTTEDPFIAGGYSEVSTSDIPSPGFKFVLPRDGEDQGASVEQYLEAYRNAFEEKDRAAFKIAEVQRLEKEASTPIASLTHARAENRASKKRASAKLAYLRGRLQQLQDDCESDTQAINAQMDLLRGRLEVGEIDRAKFDGIEAGLLRARTDMAKVRSLLQRSLQAHRSREVPIATGTFLQRLAHARQAEGVTPDAWIAWGASLAFIATIALPTFGQHSPWAAFRMLSSPSLHWLVTLPLAAAFLCALSALIPLRTIRGTVMTALWTIVSIVLLVFLHHLITGPSVLSMQARNSGFFQPGAITFVLGTLAMAVSAVAALAPARKLWPIPGVAAAAVLFTSVAVATNFFGAMTADPQLNVVYTAIPGDEAGRYEVAVNLTNQGRSSIEVAGQQKQAGAYDLYVDQRIGVNSWMPIAKPDAVEYSDIRQAAIPSTSTVTRELGLTYFYYLDPGDYKARLIAPGSAGEKEALFTLAPLEHYEPLVEDYGEARSAAAEPVVPTALAELRAQILSGEYPQFSIRVYLEDGSAVDRVVSMRDEVYGGWQVGEFNRDQKTVVLTRDGEMLILRNGVQVELSSQ